MLSGAVEVPVADVQGSRKRFDVTPLNDSVKIIQRVKPTTTSGESINESDELCKFRLKLGRGKKRQHVVQGRA